MSVCLRARARLFIIIIIIIVFVSSFVLVVHAVDSFVSCPGSFLVCFQNGSTCTFVVAYNIYFLSFLRSVSSVFVTQPLNMHTLRVHIDDGDGSSSCSRQQHITSEFNKRSLHNTTKCIKCILLPEYRRQKCRRTHTDRQTCAATQCTMHEHLRKCPTEKSLKYVKSRVSIIRFKKTLFAVCIRC